MHIELLGLPGAGKSTLIRIFLKNYRLSGYAAWDDESALFVSLRNSGFSFLKILPRNLGVIVVQLIFYHTKLKDSCLDAFIKKNTHLLKLILNVLHRSACSDKDKELTLNRFYNLFAKNEQIRTYFNKNEIVIYDEGFSQRIVSLFGYGFKNANEKDIIHYISKIPMPDQVFIIDTEIDKCLKRMENRGYPKRLRNKSENEILDTLSVCKKCIDYAANYFKSLGVQVCYIDNNRQLKDSYQDIARFFNTAR